MTLSELLNVNTLLRKLIINYEDYHIEITSDLWERLTIKDKLMQVIDFRLLYRPINYIHYCEDAISVSLKGQEV